MDIYERIIYRALGVPDVLTEENQRTAAVATVVDEAAARAAADAPGESTWATDVPLNRSRYTKVAGFVVGALISEIRDHQIDPLVGGYADEGTRRSILASLRKKVTDAEAAAGGPSPQAIQGEMVSYAVSTLVAWLEEHPDAVTDAEKLEKLDKLIEAVEDLAQGLREVHFNAARQAVGTSVDPREARVRQRAEAALKLLQEIKNPPSSSGS